MIAAIITTDNFPIFLSDRSIFTVEVFFSMSSSFRTVRFFSILQHEEMKNVEINANEVSNIE